MTFRAALHLALWFRLVAASRRLLQPALHGRQGADADAAGRSAEPQFRLEVDAPSELRKLLLTHLDLARLQYAAEADALTRSEIDRLIGAASAQALSLLETEGYFNPLVKVERVDDGAEPPLLRLSVEPGPRATIERLTLEVQGGLYDEVDGGEAQAHRCCRTRCRREWTLQPGHPFQQSAWDSAKNRVLATLRSNGYLSAQWSGTAAQVNADDQQRAPVPGGRQRPAVSRRRDTHRRPAALRREAVLPAARELVGKAGHRADCCATCRTAC